MTQSWCSKRHPKSMIGLCTQFLWFVIAFRQRNLERYVGDTPNVHRVWSVICVLGILGACPTMVVSTWDQICFLCVAKDTRCHGALCFGVPLVCLMFQYCACVLVQTVLCEWEHECECFSRISFRVAVVFYSPGAVWTFQCIILLLWFSRYGPSDVRSFAGLDGWDACAWEYYICCP